MSLILIFGFTLLCYNEVANYHVHVTDDGKIVSHSHPHKNSDNKSSDANHNHSNIQFVNFDKLGHQFLSATNMLVVTNLFVNNILEIFKTDEFGHCNTEYLLLNHFRAPPEN
ncbi:MAG: hypothetical protein KIT33_08135 [Candidatus Kapabacteria bacterium]|nr:hypothetical protein [Ignavibacteriota bacterium]MCW5884922.1 hypothetical protein [Candidatus Kapabacteria bacterium]